MALTGCFSATGRLTSPRLCARYLSSYLSSGLSSTLTSICLHLSWVGGGVIQFLPSRLIGYLGDLHGFSPYFTSPLPFLAIGFCDWPSLSHTKILPPRPGFRMCFRILKMFVSRKVVDVAVGDAPDP